MSSQFCIRVLASERPLGAALFQIAARLPRVHFSGERVPIRQSPIQTLPIENADFDFCHVEPTGVFRRVVENDASQQRCCFLGAEHFLKAFAKVGVEIVHHQMDAPRRGIHVREQVLYERHEIGFGTMISDHDDPTPAFGFNRHEQIARAGAHIFVILLRGRAGPGMQGGANP